MPWLPIRLPVPSPLGEVPQTPVSLNHSFLPFPLQGSACMSLWGAPGALDDRRRPLPEGPAHQCPLQENPSLDVSSDSRTLLPALNLQGQLHEMHSKKISSCPLLSVLGRHWTTGVNGRNILALSPAFPPTRTKSVASFQLHTSAFLIYTVAI